MGQKVNPHGLRVGVIKNWDSRWFVKDKDFGDTLVSDYNIRKFLKKSLLEAGISKIEIERDPSKVRIFIHCAKPGLVIGPKGANIEKIKAALEKMVDKTVIVNVDEVKQPDLDAQLVAENIAAQLEKRIGFRTAMKKAIRNTMRLGAKGIKISCGGRLGGAEIARNEHYHEGTIPLQTIRADIDYGFWEANTTYGKIGIKVWIYKGEILSEVNRTAAAPRENNRGRRPGNNDRGDRRNNDRRGNFAGRGGRRGEGAPREGGRRNVNA
ncbi:MAG: 30S ribosomal protein S3 [Clostridia bacterium]|nr:30S ribosomal protein S3 [Clostridia bacterium]